MPGGADAFGVYVHIPYCRRVCPYCDFNVHAAAEPPQAPYVRALLREVETWATRDPWRKRPVSTVYLGGGTPSLFSPAVIGTLLEGIAGAFGTVAGAEVTLEANPGTVTEQSLTAFRTAGVNRLSLGVQSFQPALLQRLGRDHTVDDARRAARAARIAGIDNLSLDLIYAIPGQSSLDWEADLVEATALAPSHVSAYCLTYEEGTPFAAWRAAGRIRPVEEDDEATMAELAVSVLGEAGFRRYEISSFARPGAESRHNRGYWSGTDYLGVGAGAHSFASRPGHGRRWVNHRPPGVYLASVECDGSAVAHDEELDADTARAEFCLCGLRQVDGIDVARFSRRFGIGLHTAYPRVGELIAAGLLEATADRVRLTRRGLAFADTVTATFF